MKEIAIIGPTASGKSALAIDVALKTNSIILSLDSLSVYKEIDIASAKPNLEEMRGIKHFGIDEVLPSYQFGVLDFIECYQKAKEYAKNENKNLIITGGSGFYLKVLVDGLSISNEPKLSLLQDFCKSKAYKELLEIDPIYMQKIDNNDSYRIEKLYTIYKTSSLAPSKYFEINKADGYIKDLKIFEIDVDVESLRDKISKRTDIMLSNGLIDEVIYLEKRYKRNTNSMKSIGIVEVLDYLDSKITKDELAPLISTHTAQLAKKQRTFNKTQLAIYKKSDINTLKKEIFKYFLV